MSAWRLASNLFVIKHANAHDLVVLDKITINKVQNILNSQGDDLPVHEMHLVKQTTDLFSIGNEQMIFEVVIQLQVSRKVGMHKPCNGRQKEQQCPSTTRKKQPSSTYKFLINGRIKKNKYCTTATEILNVQAKMDNTNIEAQKTWISCRF